MHGTGKRLLLYKNYLGEWTALCQMDHPPWASNKYMARGGGMWGVDKQTRDEAAYLLDVHWICWHADLAKED